MKLQKNDIISVIGYPNCDCVVDNVAVGFPGDPIVRFITPDGGAYYTFASLCTIVKRISQ